MNEYDYSNYLPAQPPKKRRKGLIAVIAVVCCVLLMLGSGFAGARIVENRYNVLQNNVEAMSPIAPATDLPGRIDGSNGRNSNNSNNNNSAGSNDPAAGARPAGNVNPSGETLSLTDLFVGANPAVVAISTETTGRNAFGRPVTYPAAGSGFIISEDGYIATNNHVIENASSISVLLYDGSTYPATLVGRDSKTDLAVLKIETENLSYLSWGDSGLIKVGEQVAAIGNPLGEFANTMTVGYISALDREINIDGTPRNMLQTDTAVNAGNSGGPLLNLKGQVIGIVAAKSSGVSVEGLGFAIPSNTAERIIGQLISDGYVKGQPVLGVSVTTQDNGGLSNVYVVSVNSGSAAEKAGLKEGDIILSANNSDISTVSELKAIIETFSPGDAMALKINRSGEEIILAIILDEYKPSDNDASIPQEGQNPALPGDGSDFPFDPDRTFPGFWDIFP